jgi:hypothetical protein
MDILETHRCRQHRTQCLACVSTIVKLGDDDPSHGKSALNI